MSVSESSSASGGGESGSEVSGDGVDGIVAATHRHSSSFTSCVVIAVLVYPSL